MLTVIPMEDSLFESELFEDLFIKNYLEVCLPFVLEPLANERKISVIEMTKYSNEHKEVSELISKHLLECAGKLLNKIKEDGMKTFWDNKCLVKFRFPIIALEYDEEKDAYDIENALCYEFGDYGSPEFTPGKVFNNAEHTVEFYDYDKSGTYINCGKILYQVLMDTTKKQIRPRTKNN